MNSIDFHVRLFWHLACLNVLKFYQNRVKVKFFEILYIVKTASNLAEQLSSKLSFIKIGIKEQTCKLLESS